MRSPSLALLKCRVCRAGQAVACANFAFAAELDGTKPPEACDKGGPSPAKTKKELLIYLRDSFAAVNKSLAAVNEKNMFDPIEGPYAAPATRLGLATTISGTPPTTTAKWPSTFAQRNRSALQPPQSAESARHLLKHAFCRNYSFVRFCTYLLICTFSYN